MWKKQPWRGIIRQTRFHVKEKLLAASLQALDRLDVASIGKISLDCSLCYAILIAQRRDSHVAAAGTFG